MQYIINGQYRNINIGYLKPENGNGLMSVYIIEENIINTY